MREYRLAADLSVIETFHRANSRERVELLEIFRALLRNPNQDGDWKVRDATGRLMEIKICRRWQVTFWLDSPVNELRVVEVSRVSVGS